MPSACINDQITLQVFGSARVILTTMELNTRHTCAVLVGQQSDRIVLFEEAHFAHGCQPVSDAPLQQLTASSEEFKSWAKAAMPADRAQQQDISRHVKNASTRRG